MNPTDPAFPVGDGRTSGMDLRTYMATAFLAAHIAYEGTSVATALQAAKAQTATAQADALIERLNAK